VFAGIHAIRTRCRVWAALAVNVALLALIGHVFWLTDWQYSLPTPRPEGLMQPPVGSRPALPAAMAALWREKRPLAINFASAKCPCTEFNLDLIRKLQHKFGDSVDFVTVLESPSDAAGARDEFQSMRLRMPVVYDRSGQVSASLGVYGTPQAAILDRAGRLYFRGNYNRSRYCTEESTEYVRLALNALVQGLPPPVLPADATIPYGCPLPRRFLVQPAAMERLAGALKP
jgi:hypothetical protein